MHQALSLQRTVSLLGVILLHAALPFAPQAPAWLASTPETHEGIGRLVQLGSYLFFPSFALSSGWLFARTWIDGRPGYLRMLRYGAQRLVLPWLLTGVLWLLPLSVLFGLPLCGHPYTISLVQAYILFLTGWCGSHLWWLTALFWVFLFWLILLPPILRLGRQGWMAGMAVAAVAASLLHYTVGATPWLSLDQVPGALIFFSLGCILRQHQQFLAALLTAQPIICLAGLGGAFAALLPYAHTAPADWLLGCAGALSVTLLCLLLSGRPASGVPGNRAWRFFQDNAFKYFLLHMPGALLASWGWGVSLAGGALPASLSIPMSFVLSLLLATPAVLFLNWLENLVARRKPGRTPL